MAQIDRFPVNKKDLEDKNISRTARKLIKALNNEMKLGQGREMIAKMLGYLNCHELEQIAENNVSGSLPSLVEKSKAYLMIAINISNILKVPLANAIGLVNQLGLHYYSAMKNGQTNTFEVESLEFQVESSASSQGTGQGTPSAYRCKDTNVVVTFKPRRKVNLPLI